VITVAETQVFINQASRLLSEAERAALIDLLAGNPTIGDVIQGLSGIRKARFGGRGKGKSGGYRVIYYFYDESLPLYLLTIYGKDRKDDLSSEDRKVLKAIADSIKRKAKERRT
jgi:mRNA-degrading endonuclease RelE of RelBE toxin-antitoxin system